MPAGKWWVTADLTAVALGGTPVDHFRCFLSRGAVSVGTTTTVGGVLIGQAASLSVRLPVTGPGTVALDCLHDLDDRSPLATEIFLTAVRTGNFVQQ